MRDVLAGFQPAASLISITCYVALVPCQFLVWQGGLGFTLFGCHTVSRLSLSPFNPQKRTLKEGPHVHLPANRRRSRRDKPARFRALLERLLWRGLRPSGIGL